MRLTESMGPTPVQAARVERAGVLSPRALCQALAVGVPRLAGQATRRWLLLANLSCALVLAGAVGVAYLRFAGASWLSEPLSAAYRLLCPQRPDHSYFPFGRQMALEQREVAMFGGQLLGGVVFGLARGRLHPLNWPLVVLLGLPLVWDGLSQTFGMRDSDWLTRTWTGVLFNLALVCWAYPLIDRTLSEFSE